MGWFYQSIKWSGRVALPLFFGRFEVKGRDNLPRNQPFLLTPNHQNAFMDAIVVGTYVPQEVSFLTRSDVFISPYDIVLRALNMIPVYRIRDGYEQLKKNEATFARCDEQFKKDRPILIFPEGNYGEGFHLRNTSKGTARMAIQSQNSLEKDLLIVPVGINYNHHDHPRTGASIIFGTPINLRQFLKLHNERPAKQILLLKTKIEKEIKELLLLPEEADLNQNSLNILSGKYRHLSFFKKKEILKNGSPLEVPSRYPGLAPLRALMTLPNIVPHFIINKIIQGLKDRQFILSLKYILGLFLFPLWWMILFITIWSIYNLSAAIVTIIFCYLILFIRQAIQNMIR